MSINNLVTGICSWCSEDENWYEAVDQQLKVEFPDIHQQSLVPGNHPYWQRHKELWAPYETLVADFTYDDNSQQACVKHLREMADAIERQQS